MSTVHADLSGSSRSGKSVARRLERLLEGVLGGALPFHLVAWDASTAGDPALPTIRLRAPAALAQLLWSPGELGLARAYVSGTLEVEGDFASALAEVWRLLRSRAGRPDDGPRPATQLAHLARLVPAAVSLGALRAPPRPRSEARPRGRLHSLGRDRAIIAHHYDLSNEFYELLLDPSMAYSCAYWTSTAPGYGLAEAQQDKLDLVCTKLGLGAGSRLLDIGCGWGSLTVHAATHFGAIVTAVTLSGEQAAYVRRRVETAGCASQVELLERDYREIPEGTYDAVSSIEMGEHVGAENYPDFAASLFRHVRPKGRVLVQQMSRPARSPGGGPFIEAYIAPDMHMRPVGETVALLEASGLEVRDVEALREHYARTCWAWYEGLEQHWDELVGLVGEETGRVWRLYLAGIAIGFELGSTGVDQILAIRPSAEGATGLASTRASWLADRPTPAAVTAR